MTRQTATCLAVPLSAEKTEWLWLVIPGLIWGASFLFIAEAMRSIGPLGLTFVRISIGFVTLSFFPSARKPIAPSDWMGTIWLGLLWLAFPLTMFPLAERHGSSALTGMLNGANPLFTAIVASVIARHLPSRRVMTGIAVGMAGAILIAIPGINAAKGSAAGVGLIIAALISYGVALNIASPLQRRNGALPVIWRAQMVALPLTAPLGFSDVLAAHWTLWPFLALLALGALGTGVAHAVISIAAGRLGATRASATTFLIPGVALLLGILVRHESVAQISVLGSCVCAGGAWLMRGSRGSGPVCLKNNLVQPRKPLKNAELRECEQGR